MKRVRRTFMFELDALRFINRTYQNRRRLSRKLKLHIKSKSDVVDIAVMQLEEKWKSDDIENR